MNYWTTDQLELKKDLQSWSALLNENILCLDQHSEFSFEKWQSIKAMGILDIILGDRFDELEKAASTAILIMDTLGNYCEDSGLNFVVATHMACASMPLLKFGSAEQHGKYLHGLRSGEIIGACTVIEHGGEIESSMQVTAEKTENGYLLDGDKIFAHNGPIADLFVVYARTDLNAGLAGGVSAFLVDRPKTGFSTGHPIKKLGLRTAPLCEISFNRCKLSSESLLGKVGQGISIHNYVKKWHLLCTTAEITGKMERLLAKCVEYIRTNGQRAKPVRDIQPAMRKAADIKIGLECSKALLSKAGQSFEQGADSEIDFAVLHAVASRNYVKAAMEAIQIFGAHGYMIETGIERYVRDSLVYDINSEGWDKQIQNIASLLGLNKPSNDYSG